MITIQWHKNIHTWSLVNMDTMIHTYYTMKIDTYMDTLSFSKSISYIYIFITHSKYIKSRWSCMLEKHLHTHTYNDTYIHASTKWMKQETSLPTPSFFPHFRLRNKQTQVNHQLPRLAWTWQLSFSPHQPRSIDLPLPLLLFFFGQELHTTRKQETLTSIITPRREPSLVCPHLQHIDLPSLPNATS